MTLPYKTIQSGAAKLAAVKAKGGSREVAAQKKAMSRSKRVRFRRAKKG